ncbi:hypothetical protein NUU61_003715 [Penicillium alfredii]|uniref:Uncharacterized protein n=1 Tax=Penicillium alfredii TaxID=1506179 RepID=A0A9W9FJY3_9EURO|nr:uncharacterized protein NUU61_003715 [Penicillium alfredii]KAJ5101493.1 hypothetical protein NUU61_003715 [Penicillium alfredii]
MERNLSDDGIFTPFIFVLLGIVLSERVSVQHGEVAVQIAISHPMNARPYTLPVEVYQEKIAQTAPRHVPRKRAYPVVFEAPMVIEQTSMYDNRPHSPLQS